MKPPMFTGKFELIADNMPAAARIAYCLKMKEVAYLRELCLDYACDHVAKELVTGTVLLSSLDDLYQEITQHKGIRRTLIKSIRDHGGPLKINRIEAGTDMEISGYQDHNTFTEDLEDE
jgi:hypothetical protein